MRPRRLSGFDYLGCHRYSLTCCTNRRHPLFLDPVVVRIGKDALDTSASAQGFDVLVYCFMPDHLHVVLEGRRDNSDFRAFASSFRRRSAFAYRRSGGTELWQPGYFEHVLRNDEATAAVVRYVAENPVRAGLTKDPMCYPFTGSGVIDLATLLLDIGGDRESGAAKGGALR
jgi:putative transposase